MKKKILALLLAGATAASMCTWGFAEESSDDYTETSTEIYNEVLGEFYEYLTASYEAETVSERYALQAIAEAKLLESGVILPNFTAGGSYAISHVAAKSKNQVMWGSDYERYHQLIVTEETIANEDYDYLTELWGDLRGTGTYETEAETYLTEKGYTLKDSFNYYYSLDPETWDPFNSYLASVSNVCVQTYDGLLEYDMEGNLNPALAESWEISEDGLTYTFHLREGVMWVDSQGRELAELTADDFVAGFQHMMDCQAGMEYLIEGVIKGASEYIAGETSDMASVGVTAVDDYTLQYTLEAPCSYLSTMLGWANFAPLCRSYYESVGGKFGAEYDSSAADYLYGTDPDHIAYCGPFVVTNATEQNIIVYSQNEAYWNADNVNIKTMTWYYSDGSDVTKTYSDYKAGTLDYVALNSSTTSLAQADGYGDSVHILDNDSTTYVFYYNLNRAAFANTNDETTVVSAQTEEDAARTKAALQNQNFRLALSFATDRVAYNANYKGEDVKYISLRNSYTPATFVALEEDTAVEIGGAETTFTAGTFYGEILQAQLDADGYPIKVWDAETQSGDGYDGWYSAENADAYLETAIAELAEEGITVDEENPICIDLPYNASSQTHTNAVNAYKQSVEAALGGKVIVNLVICTDGTERAYTAYYTAYGYESNFDVSDYTGWIPDYGDPSSYLETLLPDYAGYQAKMLGIF